MAKVQFTLLYDSLLYGPFPKRELEQLDGVYATIKSTETAFMYEVTLYIKTDDAELFSAIYVIGMYTMSIIQKNKLSTQN